MVKTALLATSPILAKNPKGLVVAIGPPELFGKLVDADWPPTYAFPALSSATAFT
jgi:hypothetical protein